MGKILRANAANPYADMSGNSAKAARFYEYGSYGPGYAINANRPQISKKKADEMIKINYLGWDPYSVFSAVGINYAGNVTTKAEQKYVITQYVSDTYNENDGNDTGLYKYNVEGYAASAGVTGGGNLLEESKNYYKAGSAKEFLDAIKSVKASGRASVIELTADIALGDKEVEGYSEYKSFITAHQKYPITHPDLISSGVSMLKLAGMSNLTIYSKNGAKITHTCIDITGSDNIIIRNIKFDELWEWDDESNGGYDRNDWDYMTIEKGSSNIWIDHCTFYKAYDGVIDIKTPSAYSNITISWCEFLPASDGGTFFDNMMNAMKANPDRYAYYKHLLESGMTHEQIRNYAYGQKKTHLLGQSDEDTSAKNITVTFANNYYKDSMDRMPRLRFGTAHVYNCIMDAQNLRNYRQDIEKTAGSEYAQKIVSNGASSNCGAHMLLENCYMSGITNALISGNGSSAAGYINAFNSIYMLDGKQAELKVALNTDKAGEVALVQDREEFKNALPYSDYVLYAADRLSTEVQPYTGAGKLKDLTTLQWERTSYNDSPLVHKEHVWNDGEISKDSTCTEAGEKVYTCKVCGETKTEAVEALGHDYSDEWTVDKEATCEEAGSKSHHCTRPGCDSKSEVTVIEALGHEWGEGKETKAPTCTEAGEKTYTCTRCSATKTEAIEALGHAYSEEWTVDKEATTTETGSKSHHCKVCGDKTDVTIIPMIKADVSINVEVVKKEDTPDTIIEGSNNEIINSVFTEEEIKAFKNGVKVEVTIDINNIENKVTDSDKKLIDNKLKADEKIGTILDIVLNKNVDGNKNSVHELNSAIKLKVAIPENIINKDASIKREYSVIRIHNGESENIPVDYNANDNTIIFETDRFSTYAIVYKDIIKNTEDNNQSVIPDNNTSVDSKDNSVATSDTMHAAGTVWLLFAISSGMICVLSRRRKKNI